MNCIDLMVEEHVYIKRMLAVVREYCMRILNNEKVRYEDFYDIIDFIRNYADRHHHGKEETMLFNRMLDEMGPIAEKLIRHGMNVEHDLGRLHVQEMEVALKKVLEGDMDARLDLIANAVSYTHLLHRHIDKEDGVVYKFAQKSLKDETMKKVDEECEAFESKASEAEFQEKYIRLLEKLENGLKQ